VDYTILEGTSNTQNNTETCVRVFAVSVCVFSVGVCFPAKYLQGELFVYVIIQRGFQLLTGPSLVLREMVVDCHISKGHKTCRPAPVP
jgi:hypothetical protein